MNYTQHYQLPQWVETDRIMMSDFNDMTAKLDTGLAAAAQGNCRIVTGSYVGTGTYGSEHPNTLTFTFQPRVIFLDTYADESYNSIPEYYILFQGAPRFVTPGGNSRNALLWNENMVSWYYTGRADDSDGPERQLNISGRTYHYITIG